MLKVYTRHFIDCLDRVLAVVEKRNTIPILGGVLFEASDGGLRLTATDMDTTVSILLVPEVIAGGDLGKNVVVVNCGELSALLRNCDDATVELSHDEVNLTVKAGNFTAKFPVREAGDFPTPSRKPYRDIQISIPGKAFIAAMGRTRFAISTEQTRYYLNGVFLHVRDAAKRELWLCATDGHRMGLTKIEMEPLPFADYIAKGHDSGYIIPKGCLSILDRLAQDGDLALKLGDCWMEFTVGNTTVSTKSIDGTFPDYGRVIPWNAPQSFEIERSKITPVIKRMKKVVTDRTPHIKLTVNAGKASGIEFSVKTFDSVSFSETVTLESIPTLPIEFGLNLNYLEQALYRFGENIAVLYENAAAPFLFVPLEFRTNPTDAPMICVQMPTRI